MGPVEAKAMNVCRFNLILSTYLHSKIQYINVFT